MTTRKHLAKHNRSSKMSTGGAGGLPGTETGAIKRAKVDIQKHLLNKNAAKADALRDAAEKSIKNANDLAKSRRDWKKEVLMTSNRKFSETVYGNGRNFFNWYTITGETQWGIDKMPEWAKSGSKEPKTGEMIVGRPYVLEPKGSSDR